RTPEAICVHSAFAHETGWDLGFNGELIDPVPPDEVQAGRTVVLRGRAVFTPRAMARDRNARGVSLWPGPRPAPSCRSRSPWCGTYRESCRQRAEFQFLPPARSPHSA